MLYEGIVPYVLIDLHYLIDPMICHLYHSDDVTEDGAEMSGKQPNNGGPSDTWLREKAA